MAHYARVNSENIVTYVTTISNNIITDENGVEQDYLALGHLYSTIPDSVGDRWIKTSYNSNIRKKYAGIGDSYNDQRDAFISPKPYESWILDYDTSSWVSPLGPSPERTQSNIDNLENYYWNEDLYQSDNTQGWIIKKT